MRTFTHKTFEFFMAIRYNNNRDFFMANHDWYADSVRGPFLDLVTALSPFMLALDDTLQTIPNRCVSRINRDIRFSHDKSPYRDYLWLSFYPRREDKDRRPTFWFDLSDAGASWGLGMYLDNKPLMNALRRQLREHPEDVRAALAPAAGFMQIGSSYKRMAIPEEVPEDLRLWYPLKTFGLQKEEKSWEALEDVNLWQRIQSDFEALSPLYRFVTSLTEEEDDI